MRWQVTHRGAVLFSGADPRNPLHSQTIALVPCAEDPSRPDECLHVYEVAEG